MFQPTVPKSSAVSLLATLELIFHVSVHDIRQANSNAIMGLVVAIIQSLIMIMVFYVLYAFLGMRSAAVRGDYMLYMMSGIFMYMTHIKAIRAVSKAEGPTSAIMKHAPMNTIVTIAAQAMAQLYLQVLSVIVILFVYHTVFTRIEIDQPVQALLMLLLAWISGVSIGMIFKAATPWAPDLMKIVIAIYTSANMIASGKLLLANATPTRILHYFEWNPLFHIIDQTRGFVFLNYTPHYSSITYPLVATAVLAFLGLLGDTFTRQHASASWAAGK